MLFMLRTHHNEIHRNPRGKSLILQSAQSLGDVQGKKKKKRNSTWTKSLHEIPNSLDPPPPLPQGRIYFSDTMDVDIPWKSSEWTYTILLPTQYLFCFVSWGSFGLLLICFLRLFAATILQLCRERIILKAGVMDFRQTAMHWQFTDLK